MNIGRRERLPLVLLHTARCTVINTCCVMPQATEDRYSRQVKLKEDFEAECLELRQQVVGQCEAEAVGDSMRVRQYIERHETSSVPSVAV